MKNEKTRIERVMDFLMDLEGIIAEVQTERGEDKGDLGFHHLSLRDLEELKKKIYALRVEVDFLREREKGD